MAAVANARRSWINITGIRRRKFLGPALLAAGVAARVVDAPGLRRSGETLSGLVGALKAPKLIRTRAQEQISRIDRTIASVEAEVSDWTHVNGEGHALYLCKAQEFVDELGRLKVTLAAATNKNYRGRLIEQSNLIEALDMCDKQFCEATSKFQGAKAHAAIKFCMSIAQTHNQTQTNQAALVEAPFTSIPGQPRHRYVHLALMNASNRHRPTPFFLVTSAFF